MSAKRHSEAIVVYGGIRASFYAQKVSLDPTRPAVDSSTVEDRADRFEKGPQSNKMGWTGFTSDDYERQIFALICADSNTKPFTVLWGTKPVPGDPAHFAMGQARAGTRDIDRGKMAAFNAELTGDSEIYYGVTMYNALFSAGLGPGTVTTPPQLLGAVPANTRMVSHLHVPDPPGVAGTPPVIITATLQSAVAIGFTSPTDRAVVNFTVGGTTVADGKEVVIDGDSTPVTDTYWAWKFVITGTGALLFPVAVGGVMPKNN